MPDMNFRAVENGTYELLQQTDFGVIDSFGTERTSFLVIIITNEKHSNMSLEEPKNDFIFAAISQLR